MIFLNRISSEFKIRSIFYPFFYPPDLRKSAFYSYYSGIDFGNKIYSLLWAGYNLSLQSLSDGEIIFFNFKCFKALKICC